MGEGVCNEYSSLSFQLLTWIVKHSIFKYFAKGQYFINFTLICKCNFYNYTSFSYYEDIKNSDILDSETITL
jgi:hypothetical protein